LNQQKTTGSNGISLFRTSGPAGLYTLEISDVTLAGYTFDPENSVLVGTVTAP
jgi:hypothetical protein